MVNPCTHVLSDREDSELQRVSYPIDREMRDQAPAWWSPDGTWDFTGSTHCLGLFRSRSLGCELTNSAGFRACCGVTPGGWLKQLEASRKDRSLPPSARHGEMSGMTTVVDRPLTAQ